MANISVLSTISYTMFVRDIPRTVFIDGDHMSKTNFKVWRYGFIVGRIWVSWYKGLELHTKNVASSKLSHSYNFFNA